METFDIIDVLESDESKAPDDEVLTLIRFQDVRQIIIGAINKYSKQDVEYKNKQFQDIMRTLITDAQPSGMQNIEPDHLMYIEQEVLRILDLFHLN